MLRTPVVPTRTTNIADISISVVVDITLIDRLTVWALPLCSNNSAQILSNVTYAIHNSILADLVVYRSIAYIYKRSYYNDSSQ